MAMSQSAATQSSYIHSYMTHIVSGENEEHGANLISRTPGRTAPLESPPREAQNVMVTMCVVFDPKVPLRGSLTR